MGTPSRASASREFCLLFQFLTMLYKMFVEALDNGLCQGLPDQYSGCKSHAPIAISSLGRPQTH